MSEYIVSARKYRPLTFDTVVGQQGLTTTLKNAIASGKLAHAYLFCGPRGVGKTTSARIFAKTINCSDPTAEGDACGQCESCLAFDERRSFNIHELDAASNNSVEDIRVLIDEVRIPPQVGKYKVFIIDEVHMLSQAAFNAFLKTLEEPPSHVVFILATTEKHKILPTILSRCQVYDFNRITVEDTIAHLRGVAAKEGYKCDDEALAVIAEKADGGMRDALSIFDQVAAFTNGDLTYGKVVAHLGVLNSSYYFQLVNHLLDREIPQSMLLLNDVLGKGFDAGLFINGLAGHLRNVMMARETSTLPLIQCSESMRAKYGEQAQRCSDRFLYRALKLCNTCDLNYRTSRNRRLLVEVTLIEIAQADDPVAGRPATELQPIFEFSLNSDAKTPTPVEGEKRNADAKPVAGASPSILEKLQQPTTNAPTLKKTNFGISISTFNTPQSQRETSAPDTTPQPQPQQEQSQLLEWNEMNVQNCWLRFATTLHDEEQIMAQRMRAIVPKVGDKHTFTITIDNGNLLPEWTQIKRRIEGFINSQTGITDADLTFEVNEQEQPIAMTRGEQFKDIVTRNPLIEKLKNTFNLDFA